MALLFDAGEFCVALVHDHVEHCVAHLLGRNLAEVLPLATAFEGAELNFFGLDGAIQRVELERGDLVGVDTNLLAPIVEESDPITEGSDFCYFAGNDLILYVACA